MTFRRFPPSGFALAGTLFLAAALPSSALAAGGTWNCTASAFRTSYDGNPPVEPLIANQGQPICLADSVGGNNLGPSSGNLAGASSAHAQTVVDQSLAPAFQRPLAEASTQDARTPSTGTPLVEMPGTVTSQVSGVCVAGQPQLSGASTAVPVKVAGQTFATDKPSTDILTGVGNLNGAVLTIKPGEEIRSDTSLTRRGVHVTIQLGPLQVLDYVVSESTVSYAGNPCTNDSPSGGGGGGGGGTGAGTGGGTGAGTGSGGGGANGGGDPRERGESLAAERGESPAEERSESLATELGESPASERGESLAAERRERGTGGGAYGFGVGFDSHGMRVDATRSVLRGGRFTRVRVECSRYYNRRACRETLTVYRVFRYTKVVEIGKRTVALRPGRWAIFSVRSKPYPRYPIYALLH